MSRAAFHRGIEPLESIDRVKAPVIPLASDDDAKSLFVKVLGDPGHMCRDSLTLILLIHNEVANSDHPHVGLMQTHMQSFRDTKLTIHAAAPCGAKSSVFVTLRMS
jgi:hypothetical protein